MVYHPSLKAEDDMRGRKAEKIEGLDKHDFDKLANQTKFPRERRRFLAFAHIKEGVSFSEAAKMVRVIPRTVIVWVAAFRKKGLDGLREKPGRGTKPYIPENKQGEFKEAVVELQKQRQGGRIRGEDIRNLIEEKYGKRPCKTGVYNSLKRAGLVWITGRSQHPKSDEKAQATFKKNSNQK